MAKSIYKKRIRELTKRNRGISLPRCIAEVNAFTNGWLGYFGLSDVWRAWRFGTSGCVVDCE